MLWTTHLFLLLDRNGLFASDEKNGPCSSWWGYSIDPTAVCYFRNKAALLSIIIRAPGAFGPVSIEDKFLDMELRTGSRK